MTVLTIIASGSRGDVQPYVALGKGLKDAGYFVRIVTSDNFEQLVTEAGLSFCSAGTSIEEITQRDEWRKVIDSGNFIAILVKMRSELTRHADSMAQIMVELLPGSDLILAGLGGLGGAFTIAEKYKIPLIQAHIYPLTPTRELPSPLAPNLPFGGALNRLSYHVTRQFFWQSTKVGDASTRKLLGLPKAAFWGPYRALARRDEPVLYGYSKFVLPRPNDWPEKHQVTGYWYLDASTGWTPPADLVNFLEAGEPPVYIGFGSMNSRNPEEAGKIALEALALSGQRGVLASGWGGLKLSALPENVHLVSSIPHSWLFERMAAVVHHGGAGTTAAALHAGVPSIIVPFFGDQPFWGKRVFDLGVGPRPIPRKKLTGNRLAEAITEAVKNQAMRRSANELGREIRTENGIQNAVEIIDRFMKNRGESAASGR
jgi:sterol 3beta-glucosyltransferase